MPDHEPMRRARLSVPVPGWLALAASAAAVAACYGTLAIVTLLSGLGASLVLHEGIWAAAIGLFTLLAVAAVGLGWPRHRRPWPVTSAIAGAALVLWTSFASYSLPLELAGFGLLVLGATWIWRLGQARRSVTRGASAPEARRRG